MLGALQLLAEAAARLEHKLDLLLEYQGFRNLPGRMPMQFNPGPCPVCEQPVAYQIDIQHSVVVRKCACTTGKIPPAFPLVPVSQPGVPSANPSSSAEYAPAAAPAGQGTHRHRR